MSWDYRVAKSPYRIVEVFYDDEGKIEGWAETNGPYGDTVDELRADLKSIAEALDKPLVTTEELEGSV